MMKMMKKNRTVNSLTLSIIILIILSLCLCITTAALVRNILTIENNFFSTGLVRINLNDGKAIITDDEFLFEPGMTVKKDFFIENESTWDVYYRLYFENVDGGLSDVLEITVKNGDTVLYTGTMNELCRENVLAANDVLRLNERRELTMYFHFPEKTGNEAMGLFLEFDVRAEAVQTKNNPYKLFD